MQHGMKQPMLRVTTPSPAYIGVRLTYKTGATALLWGMSAMPDCTDLPDDPTALARIAVNGSESQDLRNAAWQKLIPIINRIAIDAARAYHCQEIEQEAVGYIWQKLQEGKFEPEKGRFDAWASVVLHHLAADLRKQFSRRLLHSAQQIDSLIEEIPDGRATGTGAAGDAFAQQLDRLRRELDRLSHLLPCETNGVAYFAVFLLQLRLAMARRASQAGFSDPICHSDFIAECLPWHREEGELRFRLGCPALSEVWKPFAHSWASRLTGSQKRGCATSLYVYLANHCVSRRMFGPSGSCVPSGQPGHGRPGHAKLDRSVNFVSTKRT